jgi:hypothetical protein
VAIGRLVHDMNVYMHTRFRTLALEHRATIRRRTPAQAVELAVFIGSASAREAVLPENGTSSEIRPDDELLVAEISRATRR